MHALLNWRNLLIWLLSAFLIFGGLMNLAAPADIVADYARWGYPHWFHLVTGSLELAAAAAINFRNMRRVAIVMAGLIMAAAILTLVVHGEWVHAGIPVLVLLTLIAVLRTVRN